MSGFDRRCFRARGVKGSALKTANPIKTLPKMKSKANPVSGDE
jgi:hypothetical protein